MAEEESDYAQGPSGLPDFARDPLGILKRRWRWMLPVLLLGIVASAAVVSILKPRYRAVASILVASQRIPEEFVRSTVPDDILERIDTLVAQALTRERMAQLVEKFDLYPDLRESNTVSEVAMIARRDLVVEVDPSLSGRRRGESAVVFSVSFAAGEPQVAADITNEIVGLIQGEAMRLRSEQARLAVDFLRRELEETERELREQESQITQLKRQYRGELPGELDANLAKLDRLQQQRQSLALQIAEASTRVTMLSTASGADQPATPNERLLALRAELIRHEATKTQVHPDVVALRHEIEQLEAALSGSSGAPATGSPSALVAAEQRTLDELRSQLAAAEQEIRELDARVARTPLRSEELEAMEQKAGVLREEYLEFLRKVQEAELAENLELAQQGERVAVLNRAEPPTRPERNRLMYLAAGIVASLGAAAAAGVLVEIDDPVLVDAQQTERTTGLPVLGSVSRIS
jgi:uncharacterized protein involved in exopolysaccharide biosynthesis